MHGATIQASSPRSALATVADLASVPDGLNGEILDGLLVMSPRPAIRHTNAESSIVELLRGPFHRGIGGPGGWWIEMEPELHLGLDARYAAVIPDIAGWRIDRMPELPDTAHVAIVPNWVCEVVSPSTARQDRVLKLPFYARAGVDHAWLVDPIQRTLEAFERDGAAWRLLGTWSHEDLAPIAPFDAVPFDLGALWRAPKVPQGA